MLLICAQTQKLVRRDILTLMHVYLSTLGHPCNELMTNADQYLL